MSGKRPGLTTRPPGPRDLEEFLEGAGEPRQPRPAEGDPEPQTAPHAKPQSRKGGTTADFGGGGTEKFLLRMGTKHHAMLKWLSGVSRRRSMQSIALDLLEPAIEDAVKRMQEELGV